MPYNESFSDNTTGQFLRLSEGNSNTFYAPVLTDNQGIQYYATSGSTTFTAEAVPGPLPILGIPAVLFYTRKLKNRIKASREASSAS